MRRKLNIQEELEFHRSTKQLIAHEVTQRLSFFNAATIENIFQKCFSQPGAEKLKIHRSMNKKSSLHYYLRLRNLIVHNAGYVDQKFMNEVECEYPVGGIHPVTVENVTELIGLTEGIVRRIEKAIENY